MSHVSAKYTYNEFMFDRRCLTLKNTDLFVESYKDADSIDTLKALRTKIGVNYYNMLIMHIMGSTSWSSNFQEDSSYISSFPENGVFGSSIHRLEYGINSNLCNISFFIKEEE